MLCVIPTDSGDGRQGSSENDHLASCEILTHARKVLLPASIHCPRRLWVANEFLRIRRFHAGIDDDGTAVAEVVTAHVGARRVDVRRGFEAREDRPQKIGRAASDGGIVGQNDQLPFSKVLPLREMFTLFGIRGVALTAHHEAARTERSSFANVRRESSR